MKCPVLRSRSNGPERGHPNAAVLCFSAPYFPVFLGFVFHPLRQAVKRQKKWIWTVNLWTIKDLWTQLWLILWMIHSRNRKYRSNFYSDLTNPNHPLKAYAEHAGQRSWHLCLDLWRSLFLSINIPPSAAAAPGGVLHVHVLPFTSERTKC